MKLNVNVSNIASDVALSFWSLLLPFGLENSALSHVDDLNADPPTSTYPGWQPEHTDWWIEYIQEKNVKGLSKDTWSMVRAFSIARLTKAKQPKPLQLLDFIRTIDEKFEKHDTEGIYHLLLTLSSS